MSKKFEYRIVIMSMRDQQYLNTHEDYGEIVSEWENINKLGAEGWELVIYSKDTNQCIFKREIDAN